MDRDHHGSKKSRWLAPLLVVLGLQPALGVIWQAHASDMMTEESSNKARLRVLKAIPTDPSILINVTNREMPASPDILNLGKRSTPALERCLSDNVDARIRQMCAILLGRLGDRRALGTLQAALADWEPPVRAWIIEALRLIPDKSSFEPLWKLYQRKDEEPSNRRAILIALGALSDTRAVRVLRKELRKKPKKNEPDLRPHAFRALVTSRHLMAEATLLGDVSYALRSDNKSLVRSATQASAELRSPRLVPALIPLMESPESSIRNKAVYALGRIGDRKATAALLSRIPHVREARTLNNIAFALERLDPKAFYPAIRQLIEHKQAIIRLNAAFVVGDVRRPEGVALLKKALDDPSDYVKTSAIVAVGKLGDAKAIDLLKRFVDHPNLSIRQESIYAIHSLSGAKHADLIHQKLFRSKRWPVRRRAGITLGEVGDARVRPFLLSCLETSACTFREVEPYLRKDRNPSTPGRLLLAWTQGHDELTDFLAGSHPPETLTMATSAMDAAMGRGDLHTAKVAIDLVGDLGKDSARARLARRLTHTDTWLRVHTATALARLGDPSAAPVLLRDMDNLAADWLPAFVRVVQRIDEAPVRARITPEILKREKSPDVDVAIAAAAIRLTWDPDQAFFRMLDALASPSARERDLAERYIRRNRSKRLTWVMRRALARESRVHTRNRLRKLLDARS